jgi:hypothetical protein
LSSLPLILAVAFSLRPSLDRVEVHFAPIDSTRLAWAASLDLLDKVGHDACVVEVPPLFKGVCSSGESPLKMVARDNESTHILQRVDALTLSSTDLPLGRAPLDLVLERRHAVTAGNRSTSSVPVPRHLMPGGGGPRSMDVRRRVWGGGGRA